MLGSRGSPHSTFPCGVACPDSQARKALVYQGTSQDTPEILAAGLAGPKQDNRPLPVPKPEEPLSQEGL